MLTGATPSVSGIIGNDWFDRETGASVTSVSDTTVKSVGSPTGSVGLAAAAAGQHRRRRAEAGVAARRRASPEAPRVFGVSLKDRSAILPVGRGADAAYWWDTKTGSFVTSTYYMPALPAWVQAFNDRKLADADAGASWTGMSHPGSETAASCRPSWRGAVRSGLRQSVRQRAARRLRDRAPDARAARHSQRHRSLVGQLLVERFGRPHVRTGLAAGPGHRDPNRPRDRSAARAVDKVVGLQHTLDRLHRRPWRGAGARILREAGLPGGRMTTKELFDPIQQALTKRFGAGKWLLATAGSSPYLNYELIDSCSSIRRKSGASPRRRRSRFRTWRASTPATSCCAARSPTIASASRVLRGFNGQRSGDLEIILEPYWMRQAEGTTHGTPVQLRRAHPADPDGQPDRAGRVRSAGRAERPRSDAGHADPRRDPCRLVRPRPHRGVADARRRPSSRR